MNEWDVLGGPYRDHGYGYLEHCPRCRAELAPSKDGRQRCPSNCGIWVAKAGLLAPILHLASFVPEPNSWLGRLFPPARCAVCDDVMAVRTERELTFDFCVDHGVWLDDGELDAFDAKCKTGDWR